MVEKPFYHVFAINATRRIDFNAHLAYSCIVFSSVLDGVFCQEAARGPYLDRLVHEDLDRGILCRRQYESLSMFCIFPFALAT